VQLFATANTLLHTIGVHLTPVNRIKYDRNLAAVDARLDATTFTQAWAAGQAMPLEQVVAYALAADVSA
jgi:hypothetical protein